MFVSVEFSLGVERFWCNSLRSYHFSIFVGTVLGVCRQLLPPSNRLW